MMIIFGFILVMGPLFFSHFFGFFCCYRNSFMDLRAIQRCAVVVNSLGSEGGWGEGDGRGKAEGQEEERSVYLFVWSGFLLFLLNFLIWRILKSGQKEGGEGKKINNFSRVFFLLFLVLFILQFFGSFFPPIFFCWFCFFFFVF